MSIGNTSTTIRHEDFIPASPRWLLAHSAWDVFPVLMGCAHLAFQLGLLFAFPYLSWWALIPLGLFYAYCIAWNIESVAHNFSHHDYFKSKALNRAFSLIESLAIGYSQQVYKAIHRRHHIGNSDLPGPDGRTRDLVSIYQHGTDGRPEPVWRYVLFGHFRGTGKELFAEMERVSGKSDVRWAKFEDAMHYIWFAAGFVVNWKFMLYFLPFYYLGHVLSMMAGYYEHYEAKPDVPMAWGVSTYGKLYNLFWMNNGYHAEHHYRPRIHWTQMKKLHAQLKGHRDADKVHVIRHAHIFGFLDQWRAR